MVAKITPEKLLKYDWFIWLFASVFSLILPILMLAIYPEILTVPLEFQYKFVFWGLNALSLVFFGFFLIVGIKFIKKTQPHFTLLNKKLRPFLYGIGLIVIISGVGASGYLIVDEIDTKINYYDLSEPYIASPKMGAPIFQEPGKNFVCDVAEWNLIENMSIQANLQRGTEIIPLTVKNIAATSIEFEIPANCTPALYSLKLISGTTILEELYAIRVWKNESLISTEPFRIAQITDTHISPDSMPELSEYLQILIDSMAIINPDLVMITGDLTDGGKISQFEKLYELVSQFGSYGIPVFTLIGNHDIRQMKYNNLEYFNRYFAPLHFMRDIPGQNLRIINFDTGSRQEEFKLSFELPFVENALASRSEGQEAILVCHIPPYRYCDWAANANQESEFNDFCDTYEVEAVFAGHSHSDRVVGRPDIYAERIGECVSDYPELTPPFTETAYIETTGKLNGPAFRWINFLDGKIVNCSYDVDGDGLLDQKESVNLQNVSLGNQYLTSNTPGSWSGTINNSLNMDLWHTHMMIELPNTTVISEPTINIDEYELPQNSGDALNFQRTYSGTIKSIWNSESMQMVTIELDIPANSYVNITFQP